jgi:serine/threonine-protein kinase
MSTTIKEGTRLDPGLRLIGQTIDKYRVIRIIGKGGMGHVYEAINTRIQKRVALKVIDHQLAQNEEAVARFQREALAASAVESPYIVQIFDAGSMSSGLPYLVMELLRGRDLGRLIVDDARLQVAEALQITAQILKGLHHAHRAGIVHRDLKPDNVFLVDREDEPVRIKLLDFGVSKISSRSSDGVPLNTLTRQGTVVGTPYYMSPEQAQAFTDVDGRTDIYSTGAILYECLAGRPPHVGKSYEQVIVNICMKDADDIRSHNEGVPESVAQVICRALSRERDDRYRDARAMLDALFEAAPEHFSATPSNLRASGDAPRAVSAPPQVRVSSPSAPSSPSASSKPESRVAVVTPAPDSANELADTVRVGPPAHAREALESEEVPELRRSGVGPTSRPSGGAPARDSKVPTVPSPVLPHPTAVSASAPRRRWTLAVAPGVALVLGVALYVGFGTGSKTDDAATVAVSPDPAAAPAEPKADTPEPVAASAPPPPAPLAQATAADSSSRPRRPDPVPPASPHPRAKAAPPQPSTTPPAPSTPRSPAELELLPR